MPYVDYRNEYPLGKYKTIGVVRDPLKRLVSGFYDKYVCGQFSEHYQVTTFRDFVMDLYKMIVLKSKSVKIDYEHFAPQYKEGVVLDKVYDLDALDEKEFLGYFKVKAREWDGSDMHEIYTMTYDHTNRKRKNVYVKEAYNLDYMTLSELKIEGKVPYYFCFYDTELIELVKKIYANDYYLLLRV
jgi:hypothetical protein